MSALPSGRNRVGGPREIEDKEEKGESRRREMDQHGVSNAIRTRGRRGRERGESRGKIRERERRAERPRVGVMGTGGLANLPKVEFLPPSVEAIPPVRKRGIALRKELSLLRRRDSRRGRGGRDKSRRRRGGRARGDRTKKTEGRRGIGPRRERRSLLVEGLRFHIGNELSGLLISSEILPPMDVGEVSQSERIPSTADGLFDLR